MSGASMDGGRGMRATVCLIVLGAMACLQCMSLAAQSADAPTQDTRNTDIVNTNSHLPLPSFSSLSAWQTRKAHLRNQILVSAGLSPMPEKAALHPQIFGKFEGRGYTIEKVLIETLPGFYLGGNLYRPIDARAKHPGILNPHGHWQYGRLENEQVDSGPAFGISLARQGYVVFAYDMVGYTDTVQVPHRFGNATQRLWSFGPLGLQLWDSIRALDFITSLDDVDRSRIGMAGASSGATQTFLLAAIDDRIQFASPVNMVSSFMQGGDLCENAPGLRIDTSNVEIAAMLAPKPMLLVADTTDWTRNMPRDEYPAIKRIYDLYGRGDQASMVQFDAVHNFNQESREAVYKFFAQVNPGLSSPQELTEHDTEVPMLQQMMALSNRTLPANAVSLNGLFQEWRAMAEAQNRQPEKEIFERVRLRRTLSIEIPDNVISQIAGDTIVLDLPGWRTRIPGIATSGSGAVAIVIDPDGSAAAMESYTVKRLRSEGRPILALDVFQTGAAKAPRDRGDAPSASQAKSMGLTDLEQLTEVTTGGLRFLTYNVSDDAARVQDIVTAIIYARQTGREVEVYARGNAAIWATFAAAVVDMPIPLHLENEPGLQSDEDYLLHFDVPGILRAGGLAAARHLAETH
jgi:dienelactone hydrolase